MDTTSSSLLILLIAFGVQITTAGLSSVLYTGSKMHTTGSSPTIVDCTSEYRYISGMHGWKFEPICFLIGPAAAKITILLREDLTCAVFQPLIYLSHVHEASQAVCPTSLPDDGGNSIPGILGQLYHSSESLGHTPRYLDWKFMLLLVLGLVLWVFLVYEVIITVPHISPGVHCVTLPVIGASQTTCYHRAANFTSLAFLAFIYRQENCVGLWWFNSGAHMPHRCIPRWIFGRRYFNCSGG